MKAENLSKSSLGGLLGPLGALLGPLGRILDATWTKLGKKTKEITFLFSNLVAKIDEKSKKTMLKKHLF